ncbi:MAG: hypothetical protein JSW03_01550 [Candidatus Eiseniibacteriota bacterium]|nr:MAG: hypothetical protein JSW03_01550 [Candidatus Eisenbacteria bacterium]
MKTATQLAPILAVALLLLPSVPVFADGNICLVTYAQFVDAWNASQIQQVFDWNNAFESHFPGMSAQLRAPNLAVVSEIPQTPGEAGLGMGWGRKADDGQDIIAACQYQFGEDPDMAGGKLNLCVLAPCQVNTISFAMVDADGWMKSWGWSVGASGVLPCSTQACVFLSLDAGAGEAGATLFYEDAGFSIHSVLFLMFGVNGEWADTLEPDPFGFNQHVWIYWKNILIEEATPVDHSTWGTLKVLFR